jgi:mono/diheme cytochrome c family protein
MSRTTKQIIAMLGLLFVLVLGCGAYTVIEPTRADNQASYREWQSVERGAELFAQNCRTCHGNTGEGGIGPRLNIEANRPADDPVLLEELRDRYAMTITCGRIGTFMPAWGQTLTMGGASISLGGSLTDQQIQHLTALITSAEHSEKGWEEAGVLAEEIDHELELQGLPPPEAVTVTNIGPCLNNGSILPSSIYKAILTPAAPATPPPDATPETAPTLVALNIEFDRDFLLVPAGEPFQIILDNQDANIPHNVSIYTDSSLAEGLFIGEIFNGIATMTYDIDPLDAGDYYFQCDVHPNMNGALSAVE